MTCPHCGSATADDARFCGACGRATAATEPSYKDLSAPASTNTGDLVGREIAGRYRVVAKLGEGGMGAVYRGEQISLKRKVAIKVLRPELSADPGLVRRFNSEAELVAKLSHPNTVNIYDFGQDPGGALFIAMEYLEGRSLRQVTQEGPLPPVRAFAIARQIAASLADAHAHGIVHRDLKPDNVMLTERGKERDIVRVLDFGIAKLRDDNRATVNAMTRAGDLVGTPQYMAPEQIRGETVDGRTDVYALGAMLYEMITGRLPFEGTTVMAILSKHLTESPPPPTARRPELGLPPAIDTLVMAALAKQPEHRPPSMERFAEDMLVLEQQLGGFGASGLGGGRSAGYAVPSGQVSAMQPILSPAPGSGFGPPGPPPVGAAPSHASPPPPFGRPPGVPQSYPPGVLPAVPDARVQPMPHGAMPHGAMPMPMPPTHGAHAPYRAAPPPRSLLWLWILLGVLGVGAGGVAVVLAVQAEKKKAAEEKVDDGDDWEVETPTTPTTPTRSWHRHDQDDLGWSIELPPDLPTEPIVAPDGTRSFMASSGGALALVSVAVVPKAGEVTAAIFDEVAAALMKTYQATITEQGWIETGGTYRALGVVGAQTIEIRFYEGESAVTIVVYSRGGAWSAYAAERTRIFESLRLEGGT